MHPLILATVLVLHSTTVCLCQRYAERNPLPVQTIVPSDTSYYDEEYEYTGIGGYDFREDTNIYRWNVGEYPHPQENFRFCSRMKSSYVCDPDKVLSTEEADKLDKFIRELYQDTPCICEECSGDKGGIIVGIALLKYIFQPYNQHPSKTIRAFAETLRKKWKLGKCDNDILIVVATEDRMGCTDVGRSTSTYLSAEEAHRIYLENKAHFSAGHFYEGLRAMLTDYRGQTEGMSPAARKRDGGLDLGLITGSIVGAVLLLGLGLFVGFVVYRRRRMARNKEKAPDEPDDSKPDGAPNTWTKDIKVMFSSMKGDSLTPPPPSSSTKYQPCDTEDKVDPPSNEFKIDEEEVIDTTLALPDSPNATRLTLGDTSTTELLDKELTKAVEGLTTTFQPPKRQFTGHETDL